MIVGVGSDICNIRRIEKVFSLFGSRFTTRCFGKKELEELKKIESDVAKFVAALAKRFAAKESFVKALGYGFSNGILWTEIEVIHLSNGCPILEISGKAKKILNEIAPNSRLFLSLSDDYPWAQAVVIIEAN